MSEINTYQDAVDVVIESARRIGANDSRWNEFINGDAFSTVSTGAGSVPTIANLARQLNDAGFLSDVTSLRNAAQVAASTATTKASEANQEYLRAKDAAETSGPYKIYKNRSDADADLANLSDGQWARVLSDETATPANTTWVYQVVSGAFANGQRQNTADLIQYTGKFAGLSAQQALGTIQLPHLLALASFPRLPGLQAHVASVVTDVKNIGSGVFECREVERETANFQHVFDPQALNGWDGTSGALIATIYDAEDGQGSGVGSELCWVRVSPSYVLGEWGVASDGSNDDSPQVEEVVRRADTVKIPNGVTTLNGVESNRSISMMGEGWASVIKALAGSAERPLTFRDVSDELGLLLSNFAVDGNHAGKLGDALIQINDSIFTAIGLWLRDSENTSSANGVNAINVANNTTTRATGTILGCRLERFSKAPINWTGNAVGGINVANSIHGGVTAFARAPGIQINNAAEVLSVGNYLKNIEGQGIVVDTDAFNTDAILLAGNLVSRSGTATKSGAGIQAQGTSQSRAKGLLVNANALLESGYTAKDSGIFIRWYNNFNIVGDLIDGPTQNGIYIRNSSNGVVSGVTLSDAGDGTTDSDGLLAVQDSSDLLICGNQGVGGQNTNYVIRIIGDCERLKIEGNNLSGWQDAPIQIPNNFPKNSTIEFPIDVTTSDDSPETVFAFSMPAGQVISASVELQAIGSTSVRTSNDYATVSKLSGSPTLVGGGSSDELATGALASAISTTAVGLRYRVTGAAGEAVRWTGIVRLRSVDSAA